MSAKKLTFEQQIQRLEEIVAALEKGDAQLADSLAFLRRALSSSLSAPNSWTRRNSKWSN